MENMTQQNRKYFDEITIARGIGILLVVLGHALKQTGVTNTAVDVLIEVIYSFHMPLFFVLSGFVSVKILQYTIYPLYQEQNVETPASVFCHGYSLYAFKIFFISLCQKSL